jgi:hypothetical protein
MAGFFDFFRQRSTSIGAGGGQTPAIRDLAFREIKQTWSAEDGDITELENGFDWLPASHAVHVRIMPEEDGDDPSRHRLWVTTEFLRSVGSDEKTAADIGTLTSVICPTFSPVRWTKDGSGTEPADLQFFSSVYVSADTVRAFSGLLARMSVLQPFMAEQATDDFARFLRGTPALATGSKRQTDSIVSHIGEMVRGKSDGISNWTGSREFEAFVERYARNDDCFGMADRGTGMSLETPFGSDTALIRFETEGVFPGLGNGLLVRTMLRSTDTPEQICSLASLLNHLEGTQWTDFAQLGCWHLHSLSDDKSILAHSCFIPNMLFGEGLVTNYGLWAIARALWAAKVLRPDAGSKTMREILDARFGR